MVTNLGPQFHGTFRDVGDRVEAAASTGVGANFKHVRQDDTVAYATEKEKTAWDFAALAQHRHAEKHSQVPARTRVYELEHHPDQRIGEFHPDHPEFDKHTENLHEWVAPHFDVKNRIDIRPGYQGTFPEVNWNEHRKRPRASKSNPATWDDRINHPNDEDVEHGHPGSDLNQEYLTNLGKQWSTRKNRPEPESQGRLF